MSSSYSQILKSSSIIGGAAVINMIVGMIRTKLVAVILGPSGVGLVGLYQSILNMIGAVSSLGLNGSGVRDVAEAYGSGDLAQAARVVRVLRMACWATGIFGWILSALLSWPLSIWILGSPDHAGEIAVLGVTLLCVAISGGQTALLQGTRRIGDLALINILSGITSTAISAIVYLWLGKAGILPVLILSAIVSLGFTWWLSRRIVIPPCEAMGFEAAWKHARRLLGLGFALMWGGILTTGTFLLTSTLVVRICGLESNGIYTAAWTLSGLFAGFILNAMGADFLPRLTAVASNNQEMNRLVNEQSEIGILLAIPGIIITLIFAPAIIQIFYSAKFAAAATLLPWFVLGIFGRVVSWPIGFIVIAKGASRTFMLTETLSAIFHLSMIWVLLKLTGLPGVSYAFFALYIFLTIGIYFVAKALSGFSWTPTVIKLIAISSGLVATAFLITLFLPRIAAACTGSLLATASGIYCLREIARRVGSGHRIVKAITRMPGGRILTGL